MFSKYEISQFRTEDGRVLYGRVSSISEKIITLIVPGLGSSHRCKRENVCKVITTMTLPEIWAFNLSAKDRKKVDVEKAKERKKWLRKKKKLDSKTQYYPHPEMKLTEISDRNEFSIMGSEDDD